MSDDLQLRRRFFAEEVQAVANIRTGLLVQALATVPREGFLRAGPWLIRGEGDFGGDVRQTTDAHPRHVYHNVSLAIDANRQLFNGAPSVVASWIDILNLTSGERVLHVGCGLGYYTALIASCVGATGTVLAVEIDDELVAEARANLASFSAVKVVRGDGTEVGRESFDAILVSAGMTHPLEAWLESLRPAGRLVVPLTCEMGANIGKGFVFLISRGVNDAEMDVRVVAMVAIYSAIGIRDATMNERLSKAFMHGPRPSIKRLRRDLHEASPSCWLHGNTFCLSAE
jgi:protein-L-isoaspartate(D-aspartate) O-methyltransferase